MSFFVSMEQLSLNQSALAPSPSLDEKFRALATCSGMGYALANEYDRVTRDRLSKRIAALLGLPYAGPVSDQAGNGRFFFVPGDTLLTSQAAALGIVHDGQLYGGVVPFPYVATKAISHGRITEHCAVPKGWHPRLAMMLEECVLRGFAVFTL